MTKTYRQFCSWRKTSGKTLISFMYRIMIKVKAVAVFPLYLLAKIIPKKDIILFGSMNGYAVADNTKYKFINEYQENFYFITKNKKIINTAIFGTVFPVYAYSFKGIYLQLRAKTIYYTHGIFDFISFLVCGSYIIALCHGVPFKENIFKVSTLKERMAYLIKKAMPYSYYLYCNAVLCPEEKFADTFNKIFAAFRPVLFFEPLPRIKYAVKNKKSYAVLYAPTYRDYRDINDLLDSAGIVTGSTTEYLKKTGLELVIRPHPLDMEKTETVIGNQENITIDKTLDIYKSLTRYSFFITDYSSLFYDAAALNVKSYLFIDDMGLYMKYSGLTNDFFEFARKNSYSNFLALLKALPI